MQLESRAVYEDFRNRRSLSSASVPADSKVFAEKRNMSVDLFLMIALIAHNDMFSYVRSMLSPDDFLDNDGRALFILLEDSFRRESMDHHNILHKIEDEKLKALVIGKLNSGEFEVNQEKMIKDSVKSIKQRSLEIKRLNVLKTIARLETNVTDQDRIRDLVTEKMYLDEELLKLKDELEWPT